MGALFISLKLQNDQDTDLNRGSNATVNVTIGAGDLQTTFPVAQRYPEAFLPRPVDRNNPQALYDTQISNIRRLSSMLGLYRSTVQKYPDQFLGALEVLEASCKQQANLNCKEALQTNFVDVYTQQPYPYRTQYGTYLLTYDIHFPNGTIKQETPFLTEGINTMTPQDLSIEAAPENADFDQDGLQNELEKFYGTHLSNPDTDGDGVTDLEEVNNGTDAGLSWEYKYCISGKRCYNDRAEYEKALAESGH